MSPATLVKQILPQEGKNMLVRATLGEDLIGNAFATSWEFDGRTVCWVTQLCVKEKWRRRGLATQVSSTCSLDQNMSPGYLDFTRLSSQFL
jgi:hypothetical protein